MLEIFLVALRLGCTSFGGPVAHLGYFHREYVERRRWLDHARFGELVALCQFLPGPASSQTGFGIGCLQRGLAGGFAAWLGFTLPSAVLMLAFASGAAALARWTGAGWLHGLKVAAVAIVAQAVWVLGRQHCADWRRAGIALAATALLLAFPISWLQVAVIAGGAVLGLALRPVATPDPSTATPPVETPPVSRRVALACITLALLLLVGLPALAALTPDAHVALAAKFYRTGALVFGGGHVVLPLLEREFVAPGWIGHDEFLAGYGAAQALPGPLFTFSAYLGARAGGGLAGGLLALGAIFLPGLLLVAGALPYWHWLRRHAHVQAALRGANAAVVGLLLAALVHPIATSALTDGRGVALGVVLLALLHVPRVPVWATVLAAALAGAALWPA